jgi:hypothetical protein
MAVTESIIGREAKKVPRMPNTEISWYQITHHRNLVQAHLERIADFMVHGEVWWEASALGIEFLDSIEEAPFRRQGPGLGHFRSASILGELKEVSGIWKTCIEKVKSKKLVIPLPSIAIYNHYGDKIETFQTGYDLTGMHDLLVTAIGCAGQLIRHRMVHGQ